MKSTLIKGVSRRMVVVKSRDSKLFEEAHFILREEALSPPLPDLLDEANRIVEKSRFPRTRSNQKRRGAQFLAGLLLGAAIEALGLLLCYFLR